MTLLELAKELNDYVMNHPIESQLNIDLVDTEIVFEGGFVLDWRDEVEDYEEDYDCEIGFNPYMGCYDFDC